MASLESDKSITNSHSELTTTDKLELEAKLLLEGTWDGFSQRVTEAVHKPWVPALEAVAYTGLSYGLSALSKSGGELGTAAKLAKLVRGSIYFSGACNLAGTIAPTIRTMEDTWDKPNHFEMNKGTIAKTLGATVFDYSLMMGANAGINSLARLPIARSINLFSPLVELSSNNITTNASSNFRSLMGRSTFALGKAELVDLGVNHFHVHDSLVKQHNETGLKSEQQFDISQVSKVVNDKGEDESRQIKDGKKLSAGDYTFEFVNGRKFIVHIPPITEQESKPLKVMFLVPGASNTTQDSKNYVAEAHMNDQADAGSDKFITVTPLTERHFLSEDSKLAASAWSIPGTMLSDEDVKKHTDEVGYDDRDYFAGLFKLVPQIANADTNYAHWGFTAGSQGAAAIMRMAGEDRFKGVFQNLYFAGGTVEEGSVSHPVKPYSFAEDNGKHITVIRTDGDHMILPLPEHQQPELLYDVAMKAVIPNWIGMEAFDSWDQNPRSLEKLAIDHLKQQGGTVDSIYLSNNQNKKLKTYDDFSNKIDSGSELTNETENTHSDEDRMLTIRLKNDPDGLKHDVRVIILPHANHVIPGPVEGTTSITSKYTGFYSAQSIAEDFRRIMSKP